MIVVKASADSTGWPSRDTIRSTICHAPAGACGARVPIGTDTTAPDTASSPAGSATCGPPGGITRTGRYKVFPVVGSALLVVALVLMAQIAADTPYLLVAAAMVLFGLGLGGNMQPVVLAVQNAVEPTEIGVATSSVTFARQMGGTLGTAVFLSLLFATAGDRIGGQLQESAGSESFQAAAADPAVAGDPANARIIEAAESGGAGGGASGVLNDSSFLQVADPRLAEPFRVGFSEAMDLVFWLAAGVMVVGFVVITFLREEPLRQRSALQERADAEAAGQAAG